MPIFDLAADGLVPIMRQSIGSGVYESEIEELLWNNIEEITGDNLFRLARQPQIPGGGRPDVVALDKTGRVVVIEVKRDVDRNQLAQALEYAGWARRSNLDELAGLYHGSPEKFWDDWKEFTDSETLVRVNTDSRLVLVARNFDARTSEALAFLTTHGVPIQLLRVSFYVDESWRRFLNVELESEPEASPPGSMVVDANTQSVLASQSDFREISLTQVAKSLSCPVDLVWVRPRKGDQFSAVLNDDGRIALPDGRVFISPSGAAIAAADVVSYDGWYAWRLPDGRTLNDVRHEIAESLSDDGGVV
ncbi:hypothetical protein [Rhodococcoides fascians]|uniref:restriction system modified-DNA reader domain-containing protein n=1 Tax=Rhodococcoides fascians TaxID=1828 RepID=UPI0012FD0EDB|nr:hypothetical protein [Rhodococcus fascians]